MNIRHLRCFLCVFDEHSISRAAAASYMSQQALSRIIQDLERSLDVSLFERSVKGVMPTEYGLLLEPYARRIIKDSDLFEATIKTRKEQRAISVSVGILMGGFNRFSALPPRLSRSS